MTDSDVSEILRPGSPSWDNFGNYLGPEIKPEDYTKAIDGCLFLAAQYGVHVNRLQRQIEELKKALVEHNCGIPGCLCYACCREANLRAEEDQPA